MTTEVKQYIPFSGCTSQEAKTVIPKIDRLLNELKLKGTEVYIAHVVPRKKPLFETEEEKQTLIANLKAWNANRIHCSYWAEPSDFFGRVDYPGLVARFNGEDKVKEYFGDLTGDHIVNRWVQEYEIAKAVGAEAVTFHLIDYFHIDGQWEFAISRQNILDSMVTMTQRFIDELESRSLLDEGPRIELENAGFGLEYGAQTAQDFLYVLKRLSSYKGKVSVAWDINHLLHAIGKDAKTGQARFFLSDTEISPEMKELERQYGHDPYLFAHKWVEYNVLSPNLVGNVTAIHLSDNTLKTEEYFRNGGLTGSYRRHIEEMSSESEKEEYGVGIVLAHYDSHEPLGTTLKNFPKILQKLLSTIPTLSILHELKNQELDENALRKQLEAL